MQKTNTGFKKWCFIRICTIFSSEQKTNDIEKGQ